MLFFATPTLGFADVKTCVESHASGQREVKAGHLKAASELFTACGSQLVCPAEIKAECVQFLRDVERSLPTVMFKAQGADGSDVTEVRVYSGEQLLLERLDGRSFALDPGRHEFRFVFASGEVVGETLVIHEGERNRAVSVRAPESDGAGAEPNLERAPRQRLSAPFWLAAGTSVAGVGAWGVFALLGRGRQAAVEECAPHCSEAARADYDAMHRDYLIADVSLGVGLAAAGVATWLWLERPRGDSARDEQQRRARFALVPTLTPSKVELTLRASTF